MIGGLRRWLAGLILLAVSTPVQGETSASEFLLLSNDRQGAYVSGILQGMSYVMFNYDKSGYERWDACVRSQSRASASAASSVLPQRAAASTSSGSDHTEYISSS